MHLNRFIYISFSSIYWLISALLFPVWTLFVLNKGFSAIDVGFFMAASAISYLLFDIIAGFVADKYPKRVVFSASLLLTAVSYTLFSISVTYYSLMFCYCLGGISRAFHSGTLESWYVNTVDEAERSLVTKKTFSYNSIFTALSISLGVYISSLVYSSLPGNNIFILASVFTLVLAFLAWFALNPLKETYSDKILKKTASLNLEMVLGVLLSLRFNRFIFLTISYGLSFIFLESFWNPIGVEKGFDYSLISFAYSSAYVISALILFLAIRSSSGILSEKHIPLLRCLFGMSFIVFGLSNNEVLFSLSIVSIYVLSYLEGPTLRAGINESIPSDVHRTLFLSVESSVKQGMGVVSGLIGAMIYEKYGVEFVGIFLGVVCIVSVIPYTFSLRVYTDRRAKNSLT